MMDLIKDLKKLTKNELIELITNTVAINPHIMDYYGAILEKDKDLKFELYHDLITDLVTINEYNEIELEPALFLIERYKQNEDDLEGMVGLKFNLIITFVRILGLVSDQIEGRDEICEFIVKYYEIALKEARDLEILDGVNKLVFGISIFAQANNCGLFDSFRKITLNYYKMSAQEFETVLGKMIDKLKSPDFDEDGFIYDNDDYEEEDDESPAPPKFTPKEKITKLF